MECCWMLAACVMISNQQRATGIIPVLHHSIRISIIAIARGMSHG